MFLIFCVCVCSSQSLSPLFICFALDFFFSFLWHFFNKKKPWNLLETCFLSKNPKTCPEHPVFMKSEALSPEGRGLYQQCHVVLWKTHMAWQGWEQSFFLTDGSLPYPAGCRATLRGGQQLQTCRKTHVPAVFSPRHLRPPAMASNNHSSAHASLPPTQVRAMLSDRMMLLMLLSVQL